VATQPNQTPRMAFGVSVDNRASRTLSYMCEFIRWPADAKGGGRGSGWESRPYKPPGMWVQPAAATKGCRLDERVLATALPPFRPTGFC